MKFRKRSFLAVARVVAAAIVWLISVGSSNCQVTSNVLFRVLMLRTQQNIASSFTIEVDNRQYLITAKHAVVGLKDNDEVAILKNDGSWLKTLVKVLRCDEPIDIAVLVPEAQMTVTFSLKPDSGGALFGQDVYLIGFPSFPDGSIFTNTSSPSTARPAHSGS
jgi:hypothetical protein